MSPDPGAIGGPEMRESEVLIVSTEKFLWFSQSRPLAKARELKTAQTPLDFMILPISSKNRKGPNPSISKNSAMPEAMVRIVVASSPW